MAELFTAGHALVIGVGRDLPVSVADARALADALRDPGRCGYPVDQVQLLTGESATRQGILNALEKLARSAGTESTVVIFFSGHGAKIPAPSELPGYYLMPYDLDLSLPDKTAISARSFVEAMQQIPARNLLVVLDVAPGGPDVKGSDVGFESAAPGSETSSIFMERSGLVLIQSSGPGEVSQVSDSQGVFTVALIEALSGARVETQDGYVRVNDVAEYLRKVVPERTQGGQHPVVLSAQAENFAVALFSVGETQVETPPVREDDLKSIKGIGPSREYALRSIGVRRFADLAGYSPEELSEALGEQGGFSITPERIETENWIGQAAALAEAAEQELKPPTGPDWMERYGQADGPCQRFEEVRAGLSIGAAGAPAGTLTALVSPLSDPTGGDAFLLVPGGIFARGTNLFQPAPTEGIKPQDRVGLVVQEVRSETAVAALAELRGERLFHSSLPDDQTVTGTATPQIDLFVRKFGAATGFTDGKIIQIGQERDIIFEGQELRLHNCFLVEVGFSEPGDVGALVLTADNQLAVGMIVGHREGMTVCQPIEPVLEQLGVTWIETRRRYTVTQKPTDEMAAHRDLAEGRDRLGFETYVEAFARLVQDTQPPLTIGIYGAWGTGKTFLMNKIREKLENLSTPSFLLVPFEAWDYNASDKLWAGLVERVFRCLEEELGWEEQFFFNLERNLERQWRQLRSRLLPYTLVGMVVVALTVGFLLTNQGEWAAAVSGSALLGLLVRQFIAVFSTPTSQYIVDLLTAPDYQKDLGFMGRIKQDLKDFTDHLPEDMKVIVFIDDLDRCDAKKAVEVLEAVKLLLELNRFIVFLALDARIITQAVEEHYGKVLTEAEITGYEYLDKIVQIPFSIPEAAHTELRQYVGSLMGMSDEEIRALAIPVAAEMEPWQRQLFMPVAARVTAVTGARPPSGDVGPPSAGGEAPGVDRGRPAAPSPGLPRRGEEDTGVDERTKALSVNFTPDEQQVFLSFYTGLDPNPRRVKRLVNIYRLVRALLSSQQHAVDPERAAIAAQLLENPRHTMGWLIVCEQWPYAAHVMLEELDRRLRPPDPGLGEAVTELCETATARIAQEGDEALQKLDLKYDRLQSFMEAHLGTLTLGDLQRLRPFTVNFNPALSAEVRLTLSSQARKAG